MALKINIICNEVAGGWEPTDTRLGGTEESVVNWAEELVRRGYYVRIYRNSPDYLNEVHHYNGVLYLQRAETAPADVCINVKSSEIKPKEPTIYFTNETDASQKDLSKYSCVVWPSKWARDNIPVNNRNVEVVPHGYNPDKVYPSIKIPKQCIYASSPDRGLEKLLEVWPTVHEAQPDATLVLTYGFKYANLPGVISMGEVDEEMMGQLFATSQYWIHPASGGELFCMTGVKAQVSECWPIYFPIMALQETVKYGTKSTPNTLADDIIRTMEVNPTPPSLKYPDWEISTDKLIKVIKSYCK